MNFYSQGRALVLALLVSIHAIGAAVAHSLPGSVLIFSRDGPQLQVAIQIALEDLVIAEPSLNVLSDADLEQDLADEHLDLLEDYFSDHLLLRAQSAAAQLTLDRAKLNTGYNEHVGAHILLNLDWTTQSGWDAMQGDLTLIYDAVMHEVRNHRAAVFWSPNGSETMRLVEFGYRRENGAPRPVILRLPEVN